MRAILGNVIKGVKVAVAAAGILALWAGAVRVLQGAEALTRHGVTYPVVVFTYLVGGACAGAVAGLLAPLARFRLGGVLVGVVAALPFGAVAAFADSGRPPWDDPAAAESLIPAVLIGAGVGWIFPSAARRINEPAADHGDGREE